MNVLIITIDTLRTDRLSCYDKSHLETPSIDGLAARGATFTRAFCHAPLTLPAHTSIFVSQIPPVHGVRDNGRFKVGADRLTLAEYLHDKGYETGAFIGGYPVHSRFGLGQGFDVYDDRFPVDSEAGREFAEAPAATVVDKALAWAGNRTKPWFMWIHLFDPHDPYEPPEPYRERFNGRPYDGEVAYVDDQVGRVLAFLKEKNLADKTIIVLTGDHGESLGQHGELTHGFLTYNPTLWIPLIITYPGGRAVRIDDSVSHIDIFPTVCDLASLKKPDTLEGRSLVPAMNSRKLPARRIYFECLSPYYGRGWAPIRGYIDGRLKFTDSPIPEVYDLEKDFSETANLAGTRDLARLKKVLDELAGPVETSGTGQKLDAAAVEKLRSLGYTAGPAFPAKKSYGPHDDVKTLVPYHEKAMEALALSRAGREPLAIERLKEIISARPDLDTAYVNLALIYEAAGRKADARRVLLSALDSLPESYDLFSHTIGFLVTSGDYQEAISLAESRALPQMEDDPKIWVDLGICYRNLGDFAKARSAYETALAIDPTYPVIHNNLGTLHLAMYLKERDPSLLSLALDHFQKALALDPGYAAAHYGLGLTHYRAGKFDLCAAAMKRASEIDPALADAFFYLGMALYRENRLAEALSPLETYRKRASKTLTAADLQKLDEVIRICRNRKLEKMRKP